jgi:hypothetical protein
MKFVLMSTLAIVIVAFLVIIGPLALLWSLNTLFPALEIPYAIETWLAAALLIAFVQNNSQFLNRKKD